MTSTGDVIFSNFCFSETGEIFCFSEADKDIESFCEVLLALLFCLLKTCSEMFAPGAVMFLGFSTEEDLLLVIDFVSFGLLRISDEGLLLIVTLVSFTLLRFSVFCIGMDTVELSLLFVLLFDLLCCI